MNALSFIEKIREVTIGHLEELEKPLFGREQNLKAVSFASRTISSSGAGDRDLDRFIVITKDGWVCYEIETEVTALYEPVFKITERRSSKMSDNEVEQYLNSKECCMGEIHSFIKKYNEVVDQFRPVGLSKIDGLLDS